MKIRAVTVGTDYRWPLDRAAFAKLAEFCRTARDRIQGQGVEVETLRIAGSTLNRFLKGGVIVELARRLEEACKEEGINSCSLGTLKATDGDAPAAFAPYLSSALAETERVFASVLAAATEQGVNRAAVSEVARTVLQLSRATAQGFGTRRFALAANVPPNGPFFPTAYHGGGPPAFSLALEGADIALEVFTGDPEVETATGRLARAIEESCRPLEEIGRLLESQYGFLYKGLDLSLAPFPSPERSIARAAEVLGGGKFGSSGTLSAIRLIAAAIGRVNLKKCGFCGVMLPVLEDSFLSLRAQEGEIALDRLLLYSAVCGTGLDTIPLPGDVSEGQVAAILLDLCSLSVALAKPLTARLMPVPGKAAGELTEYQSPFFTNTRVLSLPSDYMGRLARERS